MKIKKLLKCAVVMCAIAGAGIATKLYYDKKQKEPERKDDEGEFFVEEETEHSATGEERIYHELRKVQETNDEEEDIEEIEATILRGLEDFCTKQNLHLNRENINITFIEGDIDAVTKVFRITDTDVYGEVHPVTLEVEFHRDAEVV